MDAAPKPKVASAGYRPDPVTTEIVRNGLIAATEEIGAAAMVMVVFVFVPVL